MVLSTGTEEDNTESRVISEIEKSPEPLTLRKRQGENTKRIHNILLKIIGNQILTPFVFVFLNLHLYLFSFGYFRYRQNKVLLTLTDIGKQRLSEGEAYSSHPQLRHMKLKAHQD